MDKTEVIQVKDEFGYPLMLFGFPVFVTVDEDGVGAAEEVAKGLAPISVLTN